MANFQCPPLYLGCPVEVSSDPSESDKSLAWVTRAMPEAAGLVSLDEGGWRLWEDCWHADDPRCLANPDLFAEEDRGVFRLTEGEIQRRELLRRLDAIEIKLAELASQIQVIEKLRPKRGRRKAMETVEA